MRDRDPVQFPSAGSERNPEAHAPRLGETVILPQMAVGFHAQRAAVLVTEPTRNGWNIHAAFDTNGREQMP